MFDASREKYVLYGRTKKTLPEVQAAWSKYDWYEQYHSGRAVARLESADFLNWDFTEPATAPAPALASPAPASPPTSCLAQDKLLGGGGQEAAGAVVMTADTPFLASPAPASPDASRGGGQEAKGASRALKSTR
jgi:hypothetical protein